MQNAGGFQLGESIKNPGKTPWNWGKSIKTPAGDTRRGIHFAACFFHLEKKQSLRSSDRGEGNAQQGEQDQQDHEYHHRQVFTSGLLSGGPAPRIVPDSKYIQE